MDLKLLDLFSGIGGFSYAAEKIVGGFETTQFVEVDSYCQSVLRKNFPNTPIHDDIRTFSAKSGQFDVFTIGFPCQDLSVAGKQRGINEQTRSGLFYESIRLLREVRPRFALFENVRNLLSHEKGETFQEVLFQIAKAGYNAEWSVVSAKDLGPVTSESECGLLRTPTTMDSKEESMKHATKMLQGKTHRSSGQPIQQTLSDQVMMDFLIKNPELMKIYQDHQMEERPHLPTQEQFVNYIREQTTIKELAAKTSIKKTTIEHWFRRDKAGFSYPTVENWEEIKPHLKTIQYNMEMTTIESKEWTTKDQMLPTPTAMDHLPQRGYESMVKQTQVHRKGRTKLANLREAVNPKTVELFNKLQSGQTQKIDSTQTGEDMYLNPHFVEEMMGYPIGWLV